MGSKHMKKKLSVQGGISKSTLVYDYNSSSANNRTSRRGMDFTHRTQCKFNHFQKITTGMSN